MMKKQHNELAADASMTTAMQDFFCRAHSRLDRLGSLANELRARSLPWTVETGESSVGNPALGASRPVMPANIQEMEDILERIDNMNDKIEHILNTSAF